MVDAAVRPASTSNQSEPHIDVERVNDLLLGTWADIRRQSRELIKDSAFWRDDSLGMHEHRERVLSQLHLLVQNRAVHRAFPKKFGGEANNGANVAGFEEMVAADPSLQIKAGVQWGLFGSAVLQLGTDEHHEKWLPGIMSLEIPGAFAMTEIGHGSDVAAVGTTATYDPATEEFVINTPFRGATKEFLGNAALHGIAATVFAQLITNGVNHGVHCFYVPLSDEDGDDLPGITREDDGLKGGLNGIDNGRLSFDHIRVPRTNLLNKYGDVAADGSYTSSIDSPGRRFFTMLGTLVQGRVSLDGAASWASALGLHIAITYATQRRQFDGANGQETVLLDYGKHQRRLLPRLATTYAQLFAHDEFLQKFDGVFSGRTDTPDDREDLETLAAALKPLSTWHALDTLQEAREACGGAGFMFENRLVGLRADLDIYVTFEGDNNVLLQLVGKRLLTDFAAQFKDKDAAALARYAALQTAGKVFHGAGLRQFGQAVADLGSTARSVEYGLREEQQHELLADRVEQMVADIAGRLRPAGKDKVLGEKLFNENQAELIEAARAHGELLQWEAFTDAVNTVPEEDQGTKEVLTWLRDLFGLQLIEKHLAWYLINGRLSAQRAASVSRYIDRLCQRLRPHALDLVNAFGWEPEHVRAPIASGAEQQRQDEAREHYAALQASGEAPVSEKALHKKKQKRA
ncbi:acyl-CoA dehydrogenase [Microbacterium sp. H1-D42]|uniref:acyl-CoA dehydrogenase family protein n=1 Tax=Microbacterium sp. H1-D42 TaxID=2925844 RepID=UPI001F53CDFF|nr:acyl-CoA dehydrogenase [Microbacterium sp. H1-D42]UNK70430.1 acyl-CoA dehydrogenase family protein [Microbacterium sp. H1-D42]